MASPTYRVRIDWGGQTGVLRVGTGHIGGPELIFGGSPSDLFLGVYDSPLSDITTDVLTGKIQRKLGNDGIVEGTLDLTLTDSWPGKYNAKNPDSPLYGLILPVARCEVDVSFDAGATWEPIFGGWLNESESEADYGSSQARINFTDLAYLDRAIDAIPSTGPTTVAAALGLVHDAIDWAGPRDFAGAATPLSDFSTDGSTTARQAIADIIKVDLGYYYVARDSTATYVDKYEYARRQSAGTFEATGQTTPGVSLSSIVNRASATGPSGITQSYEDTPSRNKYGPLPDPQGDVQSDWFADDSHALANAQWRVQVAKDPVGAYWQFQPMPTDDKAVTVLGEVLTVSGNEITDARRAEGVGVNVVGHSYDGLTGDSSFGVWEGTTNLVTNGGFETNTTGWGIGPQMARSTGWAKFGTASLAITNPASAQVAFTDVTVTPGASYVASVWVKNVLDKYVRINIAYTVDGTTWIMDSSGLGTVDSLPGYEGKVVIPFVAPGRAQKIRVRLIVDSAATGVAYFDGVQVEQRRAAVNLTVSGNEITDATRAAALQWGTGQQGGQTDGLQADSSFFIGRAATNLFRRGQCDAATDAAVFNAVVVVDATVPAPFSPQSLKVTTNGTVTGEGVSLSSATGQAMPAGTVCVGSVYLEGVAGQSYIVGLGITNTDASDTVGATTAVVATGQPQLVATPSLAVSAGKTGDKLRVRVLTGSQRAETFHVAHAMLEKGQSVVAPYVATSGGVTATKPAARVQADAGLLDETAGGSITWLRMGWASTANPKGGGANGSATFFVGNTATTGLETYFREGTQDFRVRVWSGGAALADAATPTQHFAAGDPVAICGKWDTVGGQLRAGVAANGVAFAYAQSTLAPFVLPATFDIGSTGVGAVQIDSDVLCVLTFTGTITDAEWAAVYALGPDRQPSDYQDVLSSATVTAVWTADGASYLTPGATQQIATPYVHTDGATQTRAAGRVQAPLSMLNGTQGWAAMRVRPGYPSTDYVNHNFSVRFFYHGDTGDIQRVTMAFQPQNDTFQMLRRGPGGVIGAVSIPAAFQAAAELTLVAAWTATQIALSVNGAPFVTVAHSDVPDPATLAQFNIGTGVNGGGVIDADVLWAAFGLGVLTDNDAATLNALMLAGDPDALKTALDHPSWNSTAYWAADTAAYELVNYPGTTQQEAAILAELLDVVTIAPVDLPAEDQQTQWVIHDFGGGTVHKVTWRLRELPVTRPIIVGVSTVGSGDVIATG